MKKIFHSALPVFFLFALTVILPGCVKDTYKKSFSYTYYEPVYKTMLQVQENIKSNAPKEIQNPGKIYIRGSYIFLNEIDKGLHVIDNSNPSQPKTISFIDIPGNLDIAVKGNTLYADMFRQLVAIDISNPQSVVLKKVISNVFPARNYGGYFVNDQSMVIVDWIRRDTVITQEGNVDDLMRRPNIFMLYSADASRGGALGNAGGASVSPVGIGGSMARFAVVNQRLYTVGSAALDAFNITEEQNPLRISTQQVGWNIETIFPFKDKLFIGSQTGMFIYSLSNQDHPVKEGQFSHVQSCDPVIADDNYAYVTLRSGTTCQGFTNQLEVLKIDNLVSPSLVKIYPMSNPQGLSKDGNTLFICDGSQGVKVYDASNVNDLQRVSHIKGLDAYDVIAMNGNALVVAKDGLYQYDYSNTTDIRLLSKISVNN